MKYICIIRETGALGYLAPSPAANRNKQTFGSILETVGWVLNGGVKYYVVIKPKVMYIPFDQAALLVEEF